MYFFHKIFDDSHIKAAFLTARILKINTVLTFNIQ